MGYNGSTATKICLSVWRSDACCLSIDHQRVGSLKSYCHSFIYQTLLVLLFTWCQPKSCSRSYMHFCVPWILDEVSNDPCTGNTNEFDCCLHQLSVHVGKCSIARPWFSWGHVGGKTLLSHLQMGAASTSSSTIVYCMLPGCKGQCANLASWH